MPAFNHYTKIHMRCLSFFHLIKFCVLLTCLHGLYAGNVYAGNVYVDDVYVDNAPDLLLDNKTVPTNIGTHTMFIEDIEGKLSFNEIVEKSNWAPAPDEGVAAGFTSSVYWLRFTINNQSQQAIPWNLEFAYSLIDEIELYSPTDNGEYTRIISGDNLPFSERQINYRNVVFPIVAPAKQKNTYYVRAKSTSSMILPLKLWPKNSFYKEVDTIKMLLGIFYGAVALAFLSALVNSIFLRDVMYLWLSLAFLGITLYLSGIKGLTFQYFWPNSIWWSTVNIPFFVNLGYIPTLLYCRMFTNIKELWPRFDTMCVIFIGMNAIATVLSLILSYEVMIRFSTFSATTMGIVCIVAGLYSWSKGNNSARLYVIAWSIWFIGSVTYALTALGVFPRTFLTTWSQEVGLFFFVLLMTVAQFDRFLQIQRSHEKDQLSALDAVKHAEQKYRLLFENAIEGIFQMNHLGLLTSANKAFTEIAGEEHHENLLGDKTQAYSLGFLANEEAEKLKKLLLENDNINEYAISFVNDNNDTQWVSLSLHKVDSDTSQHFNYEGSIADITETKKREQAEKQRRMAEASTEAKSMFLANMSNEIKTPMSSIIAFTDLAIGINSDNKVSNLLHKIKITSANLLGTINDILDFSKIEAGKLSIEHGPFSLKELMDNLSYIVSSNIESKNLKFTVDIDEDIPDLLIGDALRIHQVFANLTNNAVKFTQAGEISFELDLVALNKRTGTIKLVGRVIDTGIGIPEDKLESLFSSLTLTGENTTHQFGGAGLGLSISKQLLEMMGGNISVNSVEGKGSVFEFSFDCRLESRKQASALDSLSLEQEQASPTIIDITQEQISEAQAVSSESSGSEDTDNDERFQEDTPHLESHQETDSLNSSLPETAGRDIALENTGLKRTDVDDTDLEDTDFENSDEENKPPLENKLPKNLASIDLSDGLERCQENRTLYMKLLGDFIRDYSQSAVEMRTLLIDADLPAIEKLSHTLKGLAANLGVTKLPRFAKSLEEINGMQIDEQAASLDLFEAELDALVNDIQSVLENEPNQAESIDANEKYAESELKEKIEQLCTLVDEQKMEAYDLAVLMAAHWPIDEHIGQLENLVELLDLFDFANASKIIKEIAHSI